jgi:hypothetical protein
MWVAHPLAAWIGSVVVAALARTRRGDRLLMVSVAVDITSHSYDGSPIIAPPASAALRPA